MRRGADCRDDDGHALWGEGFGRHQLWSNLANEAHWVTSRENSVRIVVIPRRAIIHRGRDTSKTSVSARPRIRAKTSSPSERVFMGPDGMRRICRKKLP